MVELLISVLLVLGGLFSVIAALGVVRLPDVLIRMHASTKAGTLGCGLILAAVAVYFAETGIIARAVATIIFLMLTAPIGAHMIGRAAYRMGVPLSDRMVVDELDGRPEAGPYIHPHPLADQEKHQHGDGI